MRTAADGMGAREWPEMGGEKKPLGMSELGCAEGCGRRGCKGAAGNGWGERAWKMVACRLAMCAYRLTDIIDARGWGQGMGGDMGYLDDRLGCYLDGAT